MDNLTEIVKQALTNAECHSNKCLASENFCLVVPSSLSHIDRVMGYEVLVSASQQSITLVAKSHVKMSNDFILALTVFNEEMKHAS